VDEWLARGKVARVEAPRSSHGTWEPAPARPPCPAALAGRGLPSR